MRTPYRNRPNYLLSYEEIEGCLFVHVEIRKFNKSTLKKIKEDWSELLIELYFQGYEEVFTYTQDMRIVDLVGGGEVVGEKGIWKIVKWDLS